MCAYRWSDGCQQAPFFESTPRWRVFRGLRRGSRGRACCLQSATVAAPGVLVCVLRSIASVQGFWEGAQQGCLFLWWLLFTCLLWEVVGVQAGRAGSHCLEFHAQLRCCCGRWLAQGLGGREQARCLRKPLVFCAHIHGLRLSHLTYYLGGNDPCLCL